ncbi:635_t:CDS:2 [Gigaspora rosea]|nr:635_t:CDS:2 [Gigaspora rosea]
MGDQETLEHHETNCTVLTSVESDVASLFTGKIVLTEKKVLLEDEYISVNMDAVNNPNSSIFINMIIDEHNHPLNIDAIAFELDKQFSAEIMKDIKFLTQYCKMGATAQMKYLEGKYPAQSIYSKDLYAAIRKFRPTTKSLLNDAAQMSDWLDLQKEKDPRWVIARGWDEDNALTHLTWMTPDQVENWIKFSDCVVNDITHKTNHYGMALSFFIGFDENGKMLYSYKVINMRSSLVTFIDVEIALLKRHFISISRSS